MTKDCSPILKNSFFIYKNIRYDIEFYEITDEDIPDILWSQVYAVGNINNLVPIVKYIKSKDNLLGGRH